MMAFKFALQIVAYIRSPEIVPLKVTVMPYLRSVNRVIAAINDSECISLNNISESGVGKVSSDDLT
jgi:hypothetical protein